MDQDCDIWISLSGRFNLLDTESFVHRAMALPKNQLGASELLLCVALKRLNGFQSTMSTVDNPNSKPVFRPRC